MIRTIEKVNGQVVQKVISQYGKLLRYQYGIPGQVMTECSTLTEARRAVGKVPNGVLAGLGKPKLTLPSHS